MLLMSPGQQTSIGGKQYSTVLKILKNGLMLVLEAERAKSEMKLLMYKKSLRVSNNEGSSLDIFGHLTCVFSADAKQE